MINLSTITISTPTGKRVIYLSVVVLNLEELRNLKPGKINKLYLYNDLRDDHYKAAMPPEMSAVTPKSENMVIYYGQNFEQYYLGECTIDLDKKCYSNWKGTSEHFNEEDLKLITERLFSQQPELGMVTIFRPTMPSDINLSRRRD